MIESETLLSFLLTRYGQPSRNLQGRFTWRWPCPICHSRWPSLLVFHDGQEFHCQYCKARGDLIDFLAALHPMASPTQLAEMVGLRPVDVIPRFSFSHVSEA
jgi:hypothetical protein